MKSDVFSGALVTQMSLKCTFLQVWTGQVIKSLKLEAWTLKNESKLTDFNSKTSKILMFCKYLNYKAFSAQSSSWTGGNLKKLELFLTQTG